MSDLPTLPGYIFDPSWRGIVSLALTVLLPLVVGLLTTSRWSPVAKALLLLALAAGKAVGEAFIAGDFHMTVVYSVVVNLIIAVVTYVAFYRTAGASGSSLADWASNHGVVTPGAVAGTVPVDNGTHVTPTGDAQYPPNG